MVVQAQKFRRWFQEAVREVFRHVDVLLAPATPCTAPSRGQRTLRLGDAEVPLRPNLGLFTQPLSFIGLPVVAVPVPCEGGLPIGVQVVAAPWREEDAIRVAAALERTGVVQAPRPAEA